MFLNKNILEYCFLFNFSLHLIFFTQKKTLLPLLFLLLLFYSIHTVTVSAAGVWFLLLTTSFDNSYLICWFVEYIVSTICRVRRVPFIFIRFSQFIFEIFRYAHDFSRRDVFFHLFWDVFCKKKCQKNVTKLLRAR